MNNTCGCAGKGFEFCSCPQPAPVRRAGSNAYTTEFFAQCPNNGLRIKYRLRIETAEIIPVEQIIAAVETVAEGYHEEIADDMLTRFGGLQTLIADHHGVTIETTRAPKGGAHD